MIIESSFKPAWWLTSSHAQTMYPTLTRRLSAPIDHVERFELPDGDFIDTSWAINGLEKEAPLVILLHGLGGSVRSSYVGGLSHACNQLGWRVVLMHFRGASEEPNRLPRLYHSGDTKDLDFFLNMLIKREPDSKKALVGVSLGGNVLLKWLGEQGSKSTMSGAVAISVPFKLRLAADRMNQGLSRIYQAYLLRQMRQSFRRKRHVYAKEFGPTLENIQALKCFWTFDDQVTAPLHGFSNVHAYYREASSSQYLHRIMTPTLIIHALDDPFMTPEVLPAQEELSQKVTLELSEKGGHVGFVSGQIPGLPAYWLDQRVPEFLQSYLT